MLADDAMLIDRHGLRVRELRDATKGVYVPRVVVNTSPLPSYWEAAVRFGKRQRSLILRLETDCGSPTARQLAMLDLIENNYIVFIASALVHLRPAFARHIGDQRELRLMDDEFVPTAVFIHRLDDNPMRSEVLYRSLSDPRYEFRVRYEGMFAQQLLVDRTE